MDGTAYGGFMSTLNGAFAQLVNQYLLQTIASYVNTTHGTNVSAEELSRALQLPNTASHAPSPGLRKLPGLSANPRVVTPKVPVFVAREGHCPQVMQKTNHPGQVCDRPLKDGAEKCPMHSRGKKNVTVGGVAPKLPTMGSGFFPGFTPQAPVQQAGPAFTLQPSPTQAPPTFAPQAPPMFTAPATVPQVSSGFQQTQIPQVSSVPQQIVAPQPVTPAPVQPPQQMMLVDNGDGTQTLTGHAVLEGVILKAVTTPTGECEYHAEGTRNPVGGFNALTEDQRKACQANGIKFKVVEAPKPFSFPAPVAFAAPAAFNPQPEEEEDPSEDAE